MLAQVKDQAIHERIRKIFKVSVAESNTRVGGAICNFETSKSLIVLYINHLSLFNFSRFLN